MKFEGFIGCDAITQISRQNNQEFIVESVNFIKAAIFCDVRFLYVQFVHTEQLQYKNKSLQFYPEIFVVYLFINFNPILNAIRLKAPPPHERDIAQISRHNSQKFIVDSVNFIKATIFSMSCLF